MTELVKSCLSVICDFVLNKNIALSEENPDGRVNSSINEEIVKHYIKECVETTDFFRNNEITFVNGKARFWYDCALIKDTELLAPINIKITRLSNTSADNVSSKEGLAYALTGINPESASMNTWEKFNKVLERTNCSLDSDYYFIIVNKDNTSEVFFNSLKCINKLVSNGNNLPFQCNWSDNKTLIEDRSNKDSIKYLLAIYNESNEKKMAAAKKSVETVSSILSSLDEN